MKWRTANNRRRAKALKQGGLYTMRYTGTATWLTATGETIAADVRAMVDVMNRAACEARPVTTNCPICLRANPCPLHPFADQVAHYRALRV